MAKHFIVFPVFVVQRILGTGQRGEGGWGGPEQRGGGSSVFEPLVRGGRAIFSYL